VLWPCGGEIGGPDRPNRSLNLYGAGTADLRPLLERLLTQRLNPLAKALGATADGLPAARRLIVLPSRVMSGIPIGVCLKPIPLN
jgi:hypothetical protein